MLENKINRESKTKFALYKDQRMLAEAGKNKNTKRGISSTFYRRAIASWCQCFINQFFNAFIYEWRLPWNEKMTACSGNLKMKFIAYLIHLLIAASASQPAILELLFFISRSLNCIGALSFLKIRSHIFMIFNILISLWAIIFYTSCNFVQFLLANFVNF